MHNRAVFAHFLLTLTFLPFLAIAAPALAAEPNRDEISRLRQQIEAQQKQIDQLQKALREQQQMLERLMQPQTSPAASAPTVAAVAPASQPLRAKPAEGREQASPLFVRIGSAEFTPGGFMDLTNVFRSTNVGSGIGTSFGSIPFNNTAAGSLTEDRFSAQNSRVSLKVTANPGKQRVTAYLEADFLGALPPSGLVTSNSNSLRMRLYWVQVQRGKWEVLGGQSWSLLTPNRVGLSPMPSDLFYSMDVDTNYQVGLTWSRAPQFRMIYHGEKNWTAGVSLENPQQYVGVSNAVVLPSNFYSTQVENGSNPAAPNLHPDIIGKVAYDGRAGNRAFHVEAAGLVRGFRTVNPANQHSSVKGFGGSLNGNLELVKNLRVVLSSFTSAGGGRYIFGLGPDVVIRPDGSLSLVHSTSGIIGLEHQATPASTFYAYYGGAYFRRNYSVTGPGQFIGFGFPGSANCANRLIQEATFGLNRTFWKNPNYGALQLLTQYSYLTRSPWSVAAGSPGHADSHMVYTNLRYVLP